MGPVSSLLGADQVSARARCCRPLVPPYSLFASSPLGSRGVAWHFGCSQPWRPTASSSSGGRRERHAAIVAHHRSALRLQTLGHDALWTTQGGELTQHTARRPLSEGSNSSGEAHKPWRASQTTSGAVAF